MTDIHGFELLEARDIEELNTHARYLRHIKSGAEVLSLENTDENKVFGVTFRTPPTDSTGVAHILEHAVLAGSRKYRIKEPFVELIKGSLKTFVNAFTASDWTAYPIASQNLQDFYNLIDVYLDAVFYPLLTEHTFAQEGWHYELEEPNAPLTYKGVVFNEMKGNYASPDGVLVRQSKRSLFPDTTYGLDSGGDPRHIPDLSYEQFKAFHHNYYHPSNARIFIYGDDPAHERLQMLDQWLSDFDTLEVDSSIALQPPFEAPRYLEKPFIAGEDAKPYITLNWVLTETTAVDTNLGLNILSHILVGTPASPLRKALIDSGLGEDIAGVGMDSDVRQIYFSTGLKGIKKDDAAAVEALIHDTLESLATTGIDPRTVEASMNTIEFALRENNTGSFPRGLALMLRSLGTWIYDADPMLLLAFEAPLNGIKERLERGETYFEDLIQQYFLGNPHRTTLVLEPDVALQAKWEEEESARLAEAKASMQDADLEAIMIEQQELLRIQQTPDDPAALAAIPRLKLADLDRKNKTIPIEVSTYNGSQILFHDLFTNGITYLEVGLNLQGVPQNLLPYVPLLARSFRDLGTEKEDFVSLAQRIGSKTGGIGDSLFTSSIYAQSTSAVWLFLRGKAMVAQTGELLDILQDMLHSVRLDNQERFRQIVLEEKAMQEAQIIPAGHAVVRSRLDAHFNEAGWISEKMGGIDYLFFLRELLQDIENDWNTVLSNLEALHAQLINRRQMLWNVTLDESNWLDVQPQLQALVDALPSSADENQPWSPTMLPSNEGLSIPAQVNYVGKGANLYEHGYELNGSIHVISGYLRTTWLWERVRMQGGAYGAFCLFDPRSGVFNYLSYRDPNLTGTLDNYDGTVGYLRNLDISEDELIKSIIGSIGLMDSYMLPDAKGYVSMQRYLLGEDDPYRQRIRDEILATTAEDFSAFADVLESVNLEGHVVVLGSEDAINAANGENDLQLVQTKIL